MQDKQIPSLNRKQVTFDGESPKACSSPLCYNTAYLRENCKHLVSNMKVPSPPSVFYLSLTDPHLPAENKSTWLTVYTDAHGATVNRLGGCSVAVRGELVSQSSGYISLTWQYLESSHCMPLFKGTLFKTCCWFNNIIWLIALLCKLKTKANHSLLIPRSNGWQYLMWGSS